MKTQYWKMDASELQKVLGEEKMSMFPKKYHGPELKCGGPSMCSDCRERQEKGIPFDFETDGLASKVGEFLKDLEKSTESKLEEHKCTCDTRSLYWHGCLCKPGATKKFSIKF